LTVTVKLANFPSVTYSQDITVNVSGFTADAPINLANNTLVTDKTKIGLTWSPGSSNGGKPIIDYQISWDQGTGKYVVLASGVTTTNYTTLAALTPGTVYKFKVESRNVAGFSSPSNEVSILVVQPIRIPNMALDATINQEAFLELP